VAYYILLVLHCTHFWKWFLLPFLLVLFERVFTFCRVKSIRFGETCIKEVNLLSSNVTNLVITRPKNFKFKAGDYVFVNIPNIAKYEWHPFTISSAPEQREELTLHIRSLGNWTNKLYDYFDNFSKFNQLVNSTETKQISSSSSDKNTKFRRKMSNLSSLKLYK
jgi:predicted ferric reductase